MKVAILIADGGDGSAHLRWFRNVELAEELADNDDYCEVYGLNEGDANIIDVPDDFVPPGFWSDEDYD